MIECRETFSPYKDKAVDDLRKIHDGERDRLIDLGYRPAEPPSFERFVSDWKAQTDPLPVCRGAPSISFPPSDQHERPRPGG